MRRLTPRQTEVLRLMARGMTNAQIAEQLGLSLAGAKWHVSEVLSRLGVASREEAVALWRAEHSAGARFRAMLGILWGPRLAVTGVAIGGLGAASVAAIWVMAVLGAGDGAPGRVGGGDRDQAIAATPTSTPSHAVSMQVAVPSYPTFIPVAREMAAGEVTWEEYEAAIYASIACMEGAGVALLNPPFLDSTGRVLEYTIRLPNDPAEKRWVSSVVHACELEHAWGVRAAWAAQIRPTEEQLAEARVAMARCLVESGVPESVVDVDHLFDAQAYATGLTYPGCANRVSKEFGIPNFGG